MNKGSRALLAAARFELGVQDLPPQEKRTLFMLRSLNLSRRLYLLIAVFTISFSIFGLWSFKTLHEIKVGGEVFHRIGESKDLVSDLLPPPLYIVESYLLCLQLDRTTDASRAPDLVQRLRFLETQYRQRHAHWQERLGTLSVALPVLVNTCGMYTMLPTAATLVLSLVRVKEPTCDTMVSTLLDLVSCRILAPSMKVAKAWLPMLVPAGGAAAWAVPPPNAIKDPSIVVLNHVVMDLRPLGGGLVYFSKILSLMIFIYLPTPENGHTLPRGALAPQA